MTRYELCFIRGRWKVVAVDIGGHDFTRLARIADWLNARILR